MLVDLNLNNNEDALDGMLHRTPGNISSLGYIFVENAHFSHNTEQKKEIFSLIMSVCFCFVEWVD